MPLDVSLRAARATANMVLTTIAQGVVQQDYGMRILFPLVESNTYGGTLIQHDDSVYEDVTDDRADDAPYPEVQSGYDGRPYKIKTKGLSYRVPDKRKREMENLKIDWDRMAVDALTNKAGLRHEIESATIAGDPARYATSNKIALSAGSYLNSAGFDPDPLIRGAKTAISQRIGKPANVMVLDELSFDALATRYALNFNATQPGVRQQLTEDLLAAMYGFARVKIIRALKKLPSGVTVPVLSKKIIIGYTNPKALNADRIPFSPSANINQFEPAMGYTLVIKDNPMVFNPYYDNDRSCSVYKMDFDRSVEAVGTDSSGLITSGYLISNTLA